MMNRYIPSPRDFSSSLKIPTWIDFWLQILISLVMVCTIFTVSADSVDDDSYFLFHQKLMEQPQTKLYLLGEGETVNSIAKKHNLLLDTLRKINQFRTFSRDFNHLKLGDELSVPLNPLPKILWDDFSTSPISTRNSDIQTRKIARYSLLQTIGNSFDRTKKDNRVHDTHNDNISDLEIHDIKSEDVVNDKIRNLLKYHGFAHMQLDSDKNFSFKNLQFDLLAPLYEKKNTLIFAQETVHRTDDRIQSNLGLGYRRFTNNWILSTNSFLDYDLSRNHARLGFSSEYWRNFLKLSTNAYFHLTEWKSFSDINCKDKERPTDGWDIRAQYWLPSLPQLSGKFVYGKYYCDEEEDDLFNQDSYQRNPNSITVSMHYTPIPLLTFSAEKQYQRYSGKSDVRFSMNMKYQFGKSWKYQTDPSVVRSMRNLSGSKYNLVDRDNNIILSSYEEEEAITHLNAVNFPVLHCPKRYEIKTSRYSPIADVW